MKRYNYIIGIILLIIMTACSGSDNGDIADPFPDPTPNDPDADFIVTVVDKTNAHPLFNQGHEDGYKINNVEGLELTLKRGTTYKFSVTAPGHPFYISTSDVGEGAGEYTAGVKNGRITSGTLEFTPDSNTPDLLYYQCFIHPNMGYIINITD
jgi:hypothetical protein